MSRRDGENLRAAAGSSYRDRGCPARGNPAYPETPMTGEIQVLSKVEEVLRKLPAYRPSTQEETGDGIDDRLGNSGRHR